MKGTIITFGVSKGSCHYQGFIDQDTSFTKSSFNELEDYASRLKSKANVDNVSYVFEST